MLFNEIITHKLYEFFFQMSGRSPSDRGKTPAPIRTPAVPHDMTSTSGPSPVRTRQTSSTGAIPKVGYLL